MINSEFVPPEELQVVNGRFSISSGSSDSSAFFNMGSTHQNDDQQSSFHQPELGGFGASPLFGYQKQDQIVTPNAPPQQAPPQSGSNCSGNCGACVWSFLCKNASKKLATLGSSFVPKLG